MKAKKLTKLINNLEVKPGGSLRFYGEWFGRPYDNYHKILECMFKDGILDITFDTGETVRIWNPNNIIFDDNELTIKNATCVEFLRYYNGKPQTKESLIIDRYANDELIHPSIKSGKVYHKMIKQDYPAVELLSY